VRPSAPRVKRCTRWHQILNGSRATKRKPAGVHAAAIGTGQNLPNHNAVSAEGFSDTLGLLYTAAGKIYFCRAVSGREPPYPFSYIDALAVGVHGPETSLGDGVALVRRSLRREPAADRPHARQSMQKKAVVVSVRTTNAIERLHEEFKRRIKTQTVLPSAESAAMLFWALLASGQINMRKVDGW
jgi:hypothetical protein